MNCSKIQNFSPLTVPLCGFLGTSCPKEFWDEYLVYFVVGSSLIVLLIIVIPVLLFKISTLIFYEKSNLMKFLKVAFAFVGYAFRQKQMELQREKDEWQIPFVKLQKPPTKVFFSI